jgi:hypothetical protein
MTIPAYVPERLHANYGPHWETDWPIGLTLKEIPLDIRVMDLMRAADYPDDERRKYWDYNDGRSYDSLNGVAKAEPDKLREAITTCLEKFVATEDQKLLLNRVSLFGRILMNHHEVRKNVMDEKIAELYLGHLANIKPDKDLVENWFYEMAFRSGLEMTLTTAATNDPAKLHSLRSIFKPIAEGVFAVPDIRPSGSMVAWGASAYLDKKYG